eukprot:s251_g5.t1
MCVIEAAQLAELTWCFVDANAPLASEETVLFSLHGSDGTNPQGEVFEAALHQLQWYVPSTMAHYHSGPTHTWTHPRGHQARRDYVACSHKAFALAQSSWTDIHFDGGFAHDDHVPVMLRNAGFLEFGQAQRKIQWDPLALLDPVRCAKFQAAVKSLPVPTWQTHVDDHAALLETQILALARQFFETTSFERVRPRISEATINFIAFKRSCLDYGRAQGLMQDADFRDTLRSVEAEVRRRVKADQRGFYDTLIEQLAQAGGLHDSKQTFRLLSRLGGRKHKAQSIRALPMLHADGCPVTSFPAQQRVWLKQFADIEAGHIVSREAFQCFLPVSAFQKPLLTCRHCLRARNCVIKFIASSVPKHLAPMPCRLTLVSTANGCQCFRHCNAQIIGVHPDHAHELLTQANQDVAIRNISAHSVALLRDVLSATYFQMEGIDEIAVSTRGTRPGDPIGDVAFNLTMALVLKDVTAYMDATDAVWETPVDNFHSFQHPDRLTWAEIAYVDDLAMTLRGDSNDQVLHLAQQATNAIMQASCKRGLDPTFGAGKTELLLSPRGPGTTQVQQHIAAANNLLSVQNVAADEVWHVPVVLTYKHLGTWLNNDAKATHAVRASLTTARKAWGPLIKPFLAKKHISQETKMRVFDSLVVSRLLFNVHTWAFVTPDVLDKWESGFRPMLYVLWLSLVFVVMPPLGSLSRPFVEFVALSLPLISCTWPDCVMSNAL